jgi:hypothetical protein
VAKNISLMVAKFFFFLFFLGYFFSITLHAQTPATKKGLPKDPFTIKTYNTPATGWGYDILKDGKLMIHQPHIPAVPGNKGFATKEEAMKIAKLMKKKIQKNIMPPTIDVKELDSLKIKYK